MRYTKIKFLHYWWCCIYIGQGYCLGLAHSLGEYWIWNFLLMGNRRNSFFKYVQWEFPSENVGWIQRDFSSNVNFDISFSLFIYFSAHSFSEHWAMSLIWIRINILVDRMLCGMKYVLNLKSIYFFLAHSVSKWNSDEICWNKLDMSLMVGCVVLLLPTIKCESFRNFPSKSSYKLTFKAQYPPHLLNTLRSHVETSSFQVQFNFIFWSDEFSFQTLCTHPQHTFR